MPERDEREVWDLSDEEFEKLLAEERSMQKSEDEDETEEENEETEQKNTEEAEGTETEETEEEEQQEEQQEEEQEEKQEEEPEKKEKKKDEKKDEKPFEPVQLKSGSLVVTANTFDELVKFAQMGLDYTKKTQELAKYRDVIRQSVDLGLSQEDIVRAVKLAKEIDENPKSVISNLAKKHNIDLYEVEEAQGINPIYDKQTVAQQPQGRTPNYNPTEFVSEIRRTYGDEMVNDLANKFEALPASVQEAMSADVSMMYAFVEDVAQGTFAKVYPEVIKEVTLHPLKAQMFKSLEGFLALYREVGERVISTTTTTPQKNLKKERVKEAISNTGARRKVQERIAEDVEDYWNNDELFLKTLEQEKGGTIR